MKNKFIHRGFIQLPDESFASFWKEYESSFDFLRTQIVEFNFPIQEGISSTKEYRDAKEQGIINKIGKGLDLKEIKIENVKTYGGTIPVMILEHREDFEKVIQAFSYNNEPGEVPKSMGASTYANYNNWGRINAYKQEWFSLNKNANQLDWALEFINLKSKNFKDSFIVLSSSPYSGVSASKLSLNEDVWKNLSIEIRKYHETAHYFTKRILGSMNNDIVDEIFCDYVGLVKATGFYNVEWALTFLGLEKYPNYRKGGRLENYTDINDNVLKLTYDAIQNISAIHRKVDPYLAIYAFSYFSLVELATMRDKVEEKFLEVVKW